MLLRSLNLEFPHPLKSYTHLAERIKYVTDIASLILPNFFCFRMLSVVYIYLMKDFCFLENTV